MSSNIRIQSIDKQFPARGGDPERMVLKSFDFRIRSGELVALVGPSGCGKSTLLNLIAGLDKPTRGAIMFDQPVDSINLSVVFQQPRLLDWLSVQENIGIVLSRHESDPDRRHATVRTLLEQVELPEHAQAYPQFLSGGQRQRVSIARAFAVNPDVLLLDEPFSALDELTARRLRMLLQSLWLDGTRRRPTGVLVTHNMLEAAFLADRVIVMGGTPVEIRAVIDVAIERPRHPDDPELFAIHRRLMEALQDG
ncbi:ABC transporter ATP-binding protein [Alcaligenaceae bacterium]|nr:ABC transporter ATP-binding protein [Alcaligenaceae bacterium]